jgi:predicted N-acetyltransferase YhbS
MMVELAAREDIPEIVDLFTLVFGPKRDIDSWRIYYASTPAGDSRSYVIRTEGGKIIGHIGAIPTLYRRGNMEVRGALIVDFMVHPEYGGKGVGSCMATTVYQQMLDEDFHFSFGFSNRQSVPVSTRAGMSNLGRVPVYMRRPRWSLRRRREKGVVSLQDLMYDDIFAGREAKARENAVRSGRDFSLVCLDGFDSTEMDFETILEGPDLWHLSRDPLTLRRRYLHRPDGSYSLFLLMDGDNPSGYMVLARREVLGRDAGMVMDIWAEDNRKEAARFLLSLAVDLFSLLGVEVISCLYKGSGNITSALKRLGFLQLPQRFISSQLHLNLMVYDSLGGLLKDDMGDWLFTWGDTDLA